MSNQSVDDLRRAWKSAHLVPLWESPTAHKPPPPPISAHLWSWRDLSPLLKGAMDVTDPSAVERRVLSLVSPASKSAEDEATVPNLSAAIQMLLPGEKARPHRHSMNALRFILQGSGAITRVNGKDCRMDYGDLILTPAWTWHEHVHHGEEPAIWLDALDVPFHLHMGTARFQPGPINEAPHVIADEVFSTPGILPEGLEDQGDHSPLFCYPYKKAAQAVAVASTSRDGTRRVRYVNPTTGGSAINFLDSHLVQLDPNSSSRPMRSSASAICCVVEGHGETRVGDKLMKWSARDIFSIPRGNWIEHRSAEAASRLFFVSDRDLMAKLGLLTDEYAESTPL